MTHNTLTTHTRTRAPTRSPTTWKHRYTDTAGRGPGIPATHIDEIPDKCRKIEHWTRNQGAEALSIFHDTDTDTYYVHEVVPSNDWTHGPFNTENTAQTKLNTLKD